MAEETKHQFVDDYPYLVYAADDKAVYTADGDTPYVPGGGGDLSTATVTFELTAPEGVTMDIEKVGGAMFYYPYSDNPYEFIELPIVDNKVAIPLYRNFATFTDVEAISSFDLYVLKRDTITTSGNVEYDNDTRTFTVTGDGTVSASLKLD